MAFEITRRRVDDFNRGMQYAIEKGWVEVSTPNSIKLTDAGIAEASEITAEKTWPKWG